MLYELCTRINLFVNCEANKRNIHELYLVDGVNYYRKYRIIEKHTVYILGGSLNNY